MEVPRITFHTSTQGNFYYTDGYDGVSIADLEVLLRLSRQAIASLEGELMKRQHERTSELPGEVGKCCQRLHNTARELSVRERLDHKATKQVDYAVEILTTLQTTSPSRTYQEFLYDILRHCGTSLVLLCAASLGKKRILDLGSKERVGLLAYVKATKTSLDFSILKTLANGYDIPSSDSSKISHLTTRSRKRVRHADVTADTCQNETTEQTPQWHMLSNDQEQGHPQVLCKAVHPSSLQYQQERLTAADLLSPSSEKREMKYICTNAPASTISALPEPFRSAVQKSRLWKWEKHQMGLETTGCLATLFPKDNKQDVSFTIWCGNDEGYRLTNGFGLQKTLDS